MQTLKTLSTAIDRHRGIMLTRWSVENCRFCDLEFFHVFEIRKLKELFTNFYLKTTQVRCCVVLVIDSPRHLIVFSPIPATTDRLSHSSVYIDKCLKKTHLVTMSGFTYSHIRTRNTTETSRFTRRSFKNDVFSNRLVFLPTHSNRRQTEHGTEYRIFLSTLFRCGRATGRWYDTTGGKFRPVRLIIIVRFRIHPP